MRRIFVPAWILSTGCVLAAAVYVLIYKARVAQAETYHDLYAAMIHFSPGLRLWAIISWVAVVLSWLIVGICAIRILRPPRGWRPVWLIGILTPLIGPILTATVGWRSTRLASRWLWLAWSVTGVAVTIQVVWQLYTGAAPQSASSVDGLSFVAGDQSVPPTARQLVQELVGQPVPAVRDGWSLVLFLAFAIGTTVLMWHSAVPSRELGEAAEAED